MSVARLKSPTATLQQELRRQEVIDQAAIALAGPDGHQTYGHFSAMLGHMAAYRMRAGEDAAREALRWIAAAACG